MAGTLLPRALLSTKPEVVKAASWTQGPLSSLGAAGTGATTMGLTPRNLPAESLEANGMVIPSICLTCF